MNIDYRKKLAHFNQSEKDRYKKCDREKDFMPISFKQFDEMMNYFDWRCAYCGEKLDNKFLSLDHIKPFKKGGINAIWNLVPCHRIVNIQKRDNELDLWYREWFFKPSYYDKKRLEQIKKWQEYAYNKWHKDEFLYSNKSYYRRKRATKRNG